MGNLIRELRASIRSLWHDKGFTAVAVLTLALGIGANSAIFSVLDAVVLRPLPYQDPDELALLWATDEGQGEARGPVMPAELLYWREQAEVFDGISAYMFWAFTLTGGEQPESVIAAAVTPDLFPLLGVEAAQGRTFTAEEAVLGQGGDVVIIGHGLWQRRFGGDPGVVGRSLLLDGQSQTVVGVLPPGFDFPHEDVQLWVPLAFNPFGAGHRRPSLSVIGRLDDGVSPAQAQEVMNVVSRRLADEFPATNAGRGVEVVALREQMFGRLQPILLSLLAVVGAVLLIACVNVGSLLLARALARQNETALRKALGAGWLGLLRGPFVEGLLLALLGGAVGLLFASWALRLLTVATPAEIPRLEQAGLEPRVLGFTLLISLVSGVLFTSLPALRLLRSEPRQLLKEGGLQGGPGRQRTTQLLVVSEVALALFLLFATGLILRDMSRQQHVARGFKSENVLVAQVVLPDHKYPGDRASLFFEQLRERLTGLPGVRSVAAANTLPISTGTADFEVPFTIEGRPRTADAAEVLAQLRIVSHGYTQTLEIPMVSGRAFTAEDRGDTTPVAMVNQTMAERFWPGEDPVGERLRISFQGEHAFEVVGVMSDVRRFGAASAPAPEIYLPLAQNPSRGLAIVMATTTDPLGFREAFKNELWAMDQEQPVTLITTMEQLLAESLAGQRFHGMLMGAFALTALLLAAVGIHGVMSQMVSRRTREIGLRMALGARSADVLRSVLGRALLWTAWGVAGGAALAIVVVLAFGRYISRFLEESSPADPLAFAAAAAVLAVVALVGSYFPARRATRVDPMIALRYD